MRTMILAVASLILLASCGKTQEAVQADTGRPTSYAKDGLTFRMPGNWRVTEDEATPEVRYLFVEEPGEALVVVQLFPSQDAKDISTYARDFADASKDETKVGTFTSNFGKPGSAGGYDTLRETFVVKAYGTTLPHTRDYRRKVFGDWTCFVVAQVADEDRAPVKAGFDQIVESLAYQAP